MNLSTRLKESREAQGLSQAELARKAGVSQGTIGNLETGMRKSPKYVLAISTALGVDPMWLQYGTGHQKPILASDNVFIYQADSKNWPFKEITPDLWSSLTPHQRQQAEIFIKGMLAAVDPQETVRLSARA